MKVVVTGCAGFIGSHLVEKLLNMGYDTIGIDDFNDYYDPGVKEKNIAPSLASSRFTLFRLDILNFKQLLNIFTKEKPEKVIQCAARAGVRPSIADPYKYSQVNSQGTVNLLSASIKTNVSQFIFTSSSSVYGNSQKLPFSENDLCRDIISPYGASKRAAEFFISSFFKSYGLKSVILRLFTVYGPRGRPDMAPALFTKAILSGQPIVKFGDGTTSRDYTFISDIVDGIIKTLEADLDFEIINLGNSQPVTLNDFIKTIEEVCSRQAKVKTRPLVTGDVSKTWASIEKAKKLLSWEPKTKLKDGLTDYLKWLMKES